MQYVAAVGLSLVVLVLLANLLVDLYARAVVREALDEGVHAAVALDAAPADCERRAGEVVTALLRGPTGDGVRIECAVGAEVVSAVAVVHLPSWLPVLLPDWRFSVRALAARET